MKRPALSFRARLTLEWTVAFGALLALACLAMYQVARAKAYREVDALVRTLAATEAGALELEGGAVRLHPFAEDALVGGEHAAKVVQVLAQNRAVVAQSPWLGAPVPLLGPDAHRRALLGETPLLTLVAGGRIARVTALLVSRDGVRWVLVAGFTTARVEESLAGFALLFVLVWLAGLVVTGGLGFLLASRALSPIDDIASRARTIAGGDIAVRLPVFHPGDEIGRMTILLNEMLDRLHVMLEASVRFAADAAHELRSPLTAMQGEIDVALKRERSPAEYHETLETLRDRAAEMRHVIEDLLLLSRAEEHRLPAVVSEVPLGKLLAESFERAASLAARRRVTLDSSRVPELYVYADPRLFGRVLDNVLRNAILYNRDGGSVTFEAAWERIRGEGPAPGFVRIDVRDTGVGISEAEREKVFERFYRADPSRSRRTGGTGLGLPICREILRLLKGEIRILESSPKGTTFEIRVPGARFAVA